MSKHFVKYGHNMTGCGRYVDGLSYTDQPNDVTCKRPGCRVHMPKVEQPRRVTIPIAGSLDKECGACPQLVGDGYCNLFRFDVVYQSGYYERLPECVAAEVQS